MKAIEKNLLAQIVGGAAADDPPEPPPPPPKNADYPIGDLAGVGFFPDTGSTVGAVTTAAPPAEQPVGVEGGPNAVVWVPSHPADGNAPLSAIDGFLIGAMGKAAGGVAVAMVDGAIVGAEIGEVGGPWGIAAGIVVGGLAMGATTVILQHAANDAADAAAHRASNHGTGRPAAQP